MKRFLRAIISLSVLGFAAVPAARAATLTVSHPGNGGTYPSVVAALAAATAGDTIEIVDNSAPFIGNVYVTLGNITIQGQTGLDPIPTIQGLTAAHPLAGSLSAPQKWFWVSGDPTSAEKKFDTSGAAIINAASGLTLRNLRVVADPTGPASATDCAGALDFRFGTGGTVADCVIVATGKDRGSLTANDHLFDGVVFSQGTVPLEHHGGSGVLRIQDCLVDAEYHTLYFYGGEVQVTDTILQDSRPTGAAQGSHVGNLYGPCKTTFLRCVFRKVAGTVTGNSFCQLRIEDRGTAFGTDGYNTGRWSPGSIEALFESCDFVGSPVGTHGSIVALSNGRASWCVKTLKYTRCNIYNIYGSPFNVRDFLYPGNDYFAGGTRELFEDYNCFKQATNNAAIVGLTSGGHSLDLDQGEPLYLDAPGGDYLLAANSPAATVDGAGSPPYSGASGVSATSLPVKNVTVAHAGHSPAGDFTTLAAALDGAAHGTCITVIDNSAPFVADVDLATTNGITIQGLDTLDPRPTLKATGTQLFGLRLSGASRNFTLRNLIVDASSVGGAGAYAVALTDGGPSRIENCRILAGAAVDAAVRSQNDRLLRDCEIVCQTPGSPALSQNVNGGFLVRDCRVESAGSALDLAGGAALLEETYLSGDDSPTLDVIASDTTCFLRLDRAIVTSTAVGAAASAPDLILIRNVNRRRFLLIDNSDLVGSQSAVGAGLSPTPRGIVLQTPAGSDPLYPATKIAITDSIFYNLSSGAYLLNGNLATNTIPGLVFDITQGFEDYCAYQFASNTLNSQGSAKGANSLDLQSTDRLYADAANADFRVRPNSPAATLNSTGTPPYAGSQGLGEGPASARPDAWSLYQ